MLGYSGSQRGLLAGEASSKRGKQLPGEAGHPGRIARKFASNEVVEDATLLVLVDLRKREVHAITRNRIGHAADEDYCTVRFDLFDHTDVGKGIVQFAVAVEVPRVVEKYEVAGTDHRPLMERAMLTHVGINEADAVRVGVAFVAGIKIDAVFEEDSSRDTGAVVGNAPALALNCVGTYELGRCTHDRSPAGREFGGTTTGTLLRFRRGRSFDRC